MVKARPTRNCCKGQLQSSGSSIHEGKINNNDPGKYASDQSYARNEETYRVSQRNRTTLGGWIGVDRGHAELNGERLHRIDAWAMVRRRTKVVGISTEVCNHTFRGTGITAYLENGLGTLEKLRQLAVVRTA
jgi:hypothetical protein